MINKPMKHMPIPEFATLPGFDFGTVMLLWLCVSVISANPGLAYQGPVPPISSGFGAWGTAAVAPVETFQITSQGYVNTVTVYYPAGQVDPAPTIFFAPGWNLDGGDYLQLIHFLVSKGYVVVSDDYAEDIGSIGAQLNDAFVEAVSRYPGRIDTNFIGFIGHSSGGGLLQSLGYDFVHNHGWGGANGEHTFLFMAAPWFDFDLTDAMLQDFPTGVKMIIHTCEDDMTTDLRTYIDAFERLPVPDTEKEYITLRFSTVDGYDYTAGHDVIGTGDNGYGVFDAMDNYGVFRLADALADYTFTGAPSAKAVALGDGSDEQIGMGVLRNLISTDDPRPVPGATYDYPCDVSANPRNSHCADYDDELPASVLVSPVGNTILYTAHPEFTWEPSPTATTYFLQVRPLLPDGEPDWTISYGEDVTAGCCGGVTGFCVHTLTTALPYGEYAWWILPGNDTHGGVWSRRGYFTHAEEPLVPTTTPWSLGWILLLLTLILRRRNTRWRVSRYR